MTLTTKLTSAQVIETAADLVAAALAQIGTHDIQRDCDTPEMAAAVGYLAVARDLLTAARENN